MDVDSSEENIVAFGKPLLFAESIPLKKKAQYLSYSALNVYKSVIASAFKFVHPNHPSIVSYPVALGFLEAK